MPLVDDVVKPPVLVVARVTKPRAVRTNEVVKTMEQLSSDLDKSILVVIVVLGMLCAVKQCSTW